MTTERLCVWTCHTKEIVLSRDGHPCTYMKPRQAIHIGREMVRQAKEALNAPGRYCVRTLSGGIGPNYVYLSVQLKSTWEGGFEWETEKKRATVFCSRNEARHWLTKAQMVYIDSDGIKLVRLVKKH
jgi:hypothetical protein